MEALLSSIAHAAVVINADGTPLRERGLSPAIQLRARPCRWTSRGSPCRPKRRRSSGAARRDVHHGGRPAASAGSGAMSPPSKRVGGRSAWAMLSMEDSSSWAHAEGRSGAAKNGHP